MFVPKIPSTDIMTIVRTVAPGSEVRTIGIRPGEKLHEVLISEDEARLTVELDDFFVVQPAHPWWSSAQLPEGRSLDDGFRYSSDTNPQRLSIEDLRRMIEPEAL